MKHQQKWRTRRGRAVECPYCGQELDATTGPGTPRAGDVSICLHCAGLMEFGPDLRPRVATESFMDELRKSDVWPEVQRYQDALQTILVRANR